MKEPHRRSSNWTVELQEGRIAHLLDAPEPPTDNRTLRIHQIKCAALVLGSAQPLSIANTSVAQAAGVDVVRRRSGGGAVLLQPDQHLWVDFFVPADDPLWHDDVGLAVGWVGEVWAATVASVLEAPAGMPTVHSGRLDADRWGQLVCFAGRGPGEVFVSRRKIVGVSQRRNRRRARIQTLARLAAHPRGEPHEAVLSEADFLALTDSERSALRVATAARVGELHADSATVTQALFNSLEAYT